MRGAGEAMPRPVTVLLTLAVTLLAAAPVPCAAGQGPVQTAEVTSSLHFGFPRLGMWWPDPWHQSLDDIARYDFVILGWWAEEFLPQLRQRNPDILLLTSTNACELSFG